MKIYSFILLILMSFTFSFSMSRDSSLNPKIVQLLEDDRLNELEDQINNGTINIEDSIEKGLRLLHYAASGGKLKAVRFLLDRGASIEVQDDDGWTPFHWAAIRGHVEIIDELVSRGANLNAVTNDGYNSVHLSAFTNRVHSMEKLLSLGLSIDSREEQTGQTPLFIAVDHGQDKMISYLIERGASLQARDKEGRVPLHFARLKTTAGILINAGVDIDTRQEKFDWTVLHFAAMNNKSDLVDFLIQNNANIEARINTGWTPLIIAARYGRLRSLNVLLERGANVDAQNDRKNTALHYAARYGYEKVVSKLLEYGADASLKNIDGKTAQELAEESGKNKVLDVFEKLPKKIMKGSLLVVLVTKLKDLFSRLTTLKNTLQNLVSN